MDHTTRKIKIIMRLIILFLSITSTLLLSGCLHRGPNPDDPYEAINRKTHQFNMAFDATFLKPPAKLYAAVLPPFVRKSVNNVYNNIYMLPTVANDILQFKWQHAIKDSWRFIINTTFGVVGIIDVAETFSLPAHYNDLGVTFAIWGDKKSPYIEIPFLGPSTIRDGMSILFDYTFFTPYPYVRPPQLLYGIAALRYIDLRSQLFDSEKLMKEAIDPYAFMRDAYLQHRQYMIAGDKAQNTDEGTLYVDE